MSVNQSLYQPLVLRRYLAKWDSQDMALNHHYLCQNNVNLI